MYKVFWLRKAEKDLDDIDKSTALKIFNKIENYLSINPKELGKKLNAEYKGLYRYRYGDYRIVYELNDDQLIILIVKVGHRREVYKF